MTNRELWDMGIQSIHDLETERGILASAREEVYGCIFGRDSLIAALSLLRAAKRMGDDSLFALVGKILQGLTELQGKTCNIESGEEPGKCIHEYRPDNHDHLTKTAHEPWYVYPDGSMRNYDSIDATPLFLIAVDAYLAVVPEAAPEREQLETAAHAALQWLLEYGDSNADGFIDYRFPSERTRGGLHVQSWMDSNESVFFEDEAVTSAPAYPIAPVEAQAYAFAALGVWSRRYAKDAVLGAHLAVQASMLKRRFNASFVLFDDTGVQLVNAIDGRGRPLTAPRSSMAHCLWAAIAHPNSDGTTAPESILDDSIVPFVVERLLAPDLYVPDAGIRTLSTASRCFNPKSYHNGSIWPHDTAMAAEGMQRFGYEAEAARLRESLITAWQRFKTPIELFAYNNGFEEYPAACRTQAWSAAAILATLADHGYVQEREATAIKTAPDDPARSEASVILS